MDWLLGRYVEASLAGWTAAEMDGIETLIDLGDPELNGWILDPSTLTDPSVQRLVQAIRQFHGLPDPTLPDQSLSDAARL
jgi:succinate dehydrogenase flavin-adding protein (antitoxin of CptAB toxin-antitoxin module)